MPFLCVFCAFFVLRRRHRDLNNKMKWLGRYGDLAEHLRKVIPKEARVLIVGCGNSSLSADMYDDGYRYVPITDH